MNLLSRFQIVEGNPPNLPHKCSVCGSISGTFIDFQLDLEFYGTVYLCLENCVLQLANELGYRSPAQHRVALEAVEERNRHIIALEDENERLRHGLAGLRAIWNSTSGDVVGDSPAESQPVQNNEAARQQDSEFDGSSAISRSDDLLADDSLNSLLSNE